MSITTIAKADVIDCIQTEPFITEHFNTDNGTVEIVTPETLDKPQVETGLRFIIKGRDALKFVSPTGPCAAKLVLNYKGTDGMSDLNTPSTAA